jgi:UDP-N-acetyl-D-galactosamine dehydrogenase
MVKPSERKIAVLGLGYVGLPLALALAQKFRGVIGFDINTAKVAQLRAGTDPTGEGYESELKATTLTFSSTVAELQGANFFIVGVPTPVDDKHNPDITPLLSACDVVGSVLSPGSIVVFESTVYPGLTEEICGPALEKRSGLVRGKDFFLGYSPERINPGDKERTLAKITKIVSGENSDVLEEVATVYGAIVEAGIHRASSIKVAEAAKVIENTQRDLNIALMNELAIIFDRIGISTQEVLDAAATKWNFLRFTPGLVGGHCIGVDPYYLTTKAEQLGYHPEVILAGRRINDGMGRWVAHRIVKTLVIRGVSLTGARVGILGVTFKENVKDLRNSRVPDIIRELAEFGITALTYDPHVSSEACHEEYGLHTVSLSELAELDAVVLAVPHRELVSLVKTKLSSYVKPAGFLFDLKGVIPAAALPAGIGYWSM